MSEREPGLIPFFMVMAWASLAVGLVGSSRGSLMVEVAGVAMAGAHLAVMLILVARLLLSTRPDRRESLSTVWTGTTGTNIVNSSPVEGDLPESGGLPPPRHLHGL
jgi:uncharacterized oligopeptide transporter (OPT) family protein